MHDDIGNRSVSLSPECQKELSRNFLYFSFYLFSTLLPLEMEAMKVKKYSKFIRGCSGKPLKKQHFQTFSMPLELRMILSVVRGGVGKVAKIQYTRTKFSLSLPHLKLAKKNHR